MAWSVLLLFSASTDWFYLWVGERVAWCAQCVQSPSEPHSPLPSLCCHSANPPDICCHGPSSSDLPALRGPCSLKMNNGLKKKKKSLYEFLICFLKFLCVIKIAAGSKVTFSLLGKIQMLFNAEDIFKLRMCAWIPTHQTSLPAQVVQLF